MRRRFNNWAQSKKLFGNYSRTDNALVIMIKLPNKKAETVQEAFAKRLNELPDFLRRTMTYDNGVEMAQHKKLSQKTGMNIYFAHLYHSWERGSNENMNGVIRRFQSKKTDFNKVSAKEIEELEQRINNRLRKVLGYKTPYEMMIKKLKKHKNIIIM